MHKVGCALLALIFWLSCGCKHRQKVHAVAANNSSKALKAYTFAVRLVLPLELSAQGNDLLVSGYFKPVWSDMEVQKDRVELPFTVRNLRAVQSWGQMACDNALLLHNSYSRDIVFVGIERRGGPNRVYEGEAEPGGRVLIALYGDGKSDADAGGLIVQLE